MNPFPSRTRTGKPALPHAVARLFRGFRQSAVTAFLSSSVGDRQGTTKKLRREEKSMHHHRGNPPFFSFSGSEASMVYTLLSRPMVYTLFPCFPRSMVYTTVSFSL